MNRVLVVFSDGLLSELDSARGLVSRSAWIRQAVEDKLMKEAVAPLVPDTVFDGCFPFKSQLPPLDDEEPEAIDLMVAVRDEINRRKAITPNEFDAYKAEQKPKARRKKIDAVVTQRGIQPSDVQIPVRCHCKRGMIIGAGPRKGQCTVCGNPKPLKELNGG